MQIISPELIKNKKVLLRLDVDVPLVRMDIGYQIQDDFRLNAGVDTLKICLENAQLVTVMGHLGRPKGPDKSLSIKPITEWIKKRFSDSKARLDVLENLRFNPAEESEDISFTKELASLGNIFINESFAAYRPSASTTVLPTLLPHAAGLRFAKEVEILTKVRENPAKPLVVIMGGAKVEDKLPVIESMAKIADAVLVGGLLPREINQKNIHVSANVLVGKLNEVGSDIAAETTESWRKVILGAKTIVGNIIMGNVEKQENDQSLKIVDMIIESGAESIVGGGDTILYITKLGLIDKFSFVSTGGGAMLKFLADGTLPTIQALD